MHYFIGNFGHLLVITAFITSLLAAIGYFVGTKNENQKNWIQYGTVFFYIHALSVLGIFITLFLIINRHYFEYHYAWNYTSKLLPVYYQISSFWNGQEGSFLLWTGWNAIIGIVLIHTNNFWRGSIMTVMSITQVFLISMVMGVVIFNVKIGSSPFILLRDVLNDTVFTINPDFVPKDGNGLNPLLQNYWMVIHPPTLFLGFATTVVPFAFAIAGLWRNQYKEWIRPALPWTIFSTLILGIGILMGAYWAYETLNFGGYWNWDPVENAVYVPWLILVAAMHTMIAYRESDKALKSALILALTAFILILYSTFLTRSGVLGETSVHSFTDLGLSGQLLFYLGAYAVFAYGFVIYKWKKLPVDDHQTSVYSREFWIFMGATVLCLMGFQVIIPTSIPVYNEIVALFGWSSNLAPPADQVEFYSKFQLWFAILLAVLSGTGQFFWWKKIDKVTLKNALRIPIIATLLISSVIVSLAKIYHPGYILLLTASIYSIIANSSILLALQKTNLKLSGGSVTHIGIALMLIGILFSSGYSKILSKNNTGLLWSKEFPDEVNQNNLLLFLNEPRQMDDYSMIYKGMRKKVKQLGFVDVNDLILTDHPLKLIIKKDFVKDNELVASAGDTVTIINAENSYFEVLYTKSNGNEFTLYPRVQLNEAMGVVYSPDINRNISADMYTHVRTFPDPKQETEWGGMKEVNIVVGETFFINDYVAKLIKIEPMKEVMGVAMTSNDAAVKAILSIEGEYKTYFAEPLFVIKDQMAGRIPDTVHDLAAKITLLSIQPETNSFTLGIQTTQKDWIIMEAVEKPLINVLWIGTFILILGMTIAIIRRYSEFKKMRSKGLESK